MNNCHIFNRNSTYQAKKILKIYLFLFQAVNLGEIPAACFQDTFGQIVCEQLD